MKKFLTTSLVSIILAAVGVCLLLKPKTFVSWLFYIVGGFCILIAAIKFYSAYKKNTIQKDAIICVALLAMGIILVILQASVLEVIPLIIGICLLVYGILKLKTAFIIKKINEKAFKPLAISACVGIALAIVIIACSGLAIEIVLRIIGGILLYDALENIFSVIVAKEDTKNKNEPIEAKAEEIEDKD